MHKDIATLLNVKITLVAKVASQEVMNIEKRFRNSILLSDVNTTNVEHDVPELSIIGNLGVHTITHWAILRFNYVCMVERHCDSQWHTCMYRKMQGYSLCTVKHWEI